MIRATPFDQPMRRRDRFLIALPILAVVFAHGCSLQRLAVDRLGDALAKQGEVYAADDDPDLVGEAAPFSLKLIESLLAESPRHPGLLLAATRGFTQYSYGWIQEKADERRNSDPDGSAYQQDRARRLYIRARNYGLRGLEVAHAGLEQSVRSDPRHGLQQLTRSDVPLLYWTAASWGLAISLSKDQPEAVADLPIVEAMMDRALELDESFERGAIHSAMITLEMNRAAGVTGRDARARRHFDRAVELSEGKLASPFVTFAEAVSVETQNRAEFETLLGRALAIDADAWPEWRLENRIAQRRARWLLTQVDDLFLGDAKEGKP